MSCIYWKFGVSFPLLAIMAWEKNTCTDSEHFKQSTMKNYLHINLMDEETSNFQLDYIIVPMGRYQIQQGIVSY
jgi:hypothetical protein